MELPPAFSSLFPDPDASAAQSPPFPPFPVRPPTSTFPELTQEQKQAQRKLARVAKKIQKKADQEQKKIDEKRSINSGKVKVIDRKTADLFHAARNEGAGIVSDSNRIAPQKWQSKPLKVDLVDSIQKPHLEEPLPRKAPKSEPQVSKNKGKKREVPKKNLTRLKKAIVRERLAANTQSSEASSSSDDEDIVEALAECHVSDVPAAISGITHSRNFRPYCNHFITHEIRQLSEQLLQKLATFQDRSHEANPVKAKANKRYVVGMNDVTKQLLAKRLSLIMIAPDIEPKQCLDELVTDIQKKADALKVPVVYSLKRRMIGWLLHKKVPVCAVGVLSYDGCGDIVETLLQLVGIERKKYLKKL